jgi:hypothetical protein
MHRLLIGIAKLQLWHYPGRGKYFVVFRALIVDLLKWLPIQIAMRKFFLNSGRKQFGTVLGNRVELDLPTPVFVQGHRTLRAFEWALHNSDFDYIVRITSTCLINEPALMRMIERLPENRVYSGQVTESFGSGLFISGASLVLSRDVVVGIVEHQNKYRFDIYEDVALGRLISEFDIGDRIPMERLDLATVRAAEIVALEELIRAPIIRCKAEDLTRSAEPVLKIFDVVADRLGWIRNSI